MGESYRAYPSYPVGSPCRVKGCNRTVSTFGLCRGHYMRQRSNKGKLYEEIPLRTRRLRPPRVRKLTTVQWVYLAAALDCEGCIGAHFRENKSGITVTLSLGNTDPRLPYLFLKCLGGGLHKRVGEGNRRTVWLWKNGSKSDVPIILEACLPFLRIKRDQARLALAILKETRLSVVEPLVAELAQLKRRNWDGWNNA